MEIVGDEDNDTLDGTAGSDVIRGLGGADLLRGGDGDDLLIGGAGADILGGGNGNDTLVADQGELLDGGAGNDLLIGAGQAGVMYGYDGDDRFDLNAVTSLVASDIEGGDGFDSVDLVNGDLQLATSLPLRAIERIDSTGTHFRGTPGVDVYDFFFLEPYSGTLGRPTALLVSAGAGNDVVVAPMADPGSVIHVFNGEAGNDALDGGPGGDRLNGGADNDSLTGFDGADTLDGSAGIDSLAGYDGNDVYVVDHPLDIVFEAGDTAFELDTVRASVSWTLGPGLERLVLTSAAAINGTGNALANRLTGNAAANVLNGGTGADTLVGGAGNDTYVVDNPGDIVSETGSASNEIDTVRSSVGRTLGANLEKLVLTGSAAINGTGNVLANTLTGNSAANLLRGGAGQDTLTGGAGNDTLEGGLGNDRLVGGTGQDLFRFANTPGTDNADQLQGFVAADDSFQLARTVFSAIGVGTLAAGAFRAGTAAGDTNDRIVYDSASGQLFYDADGSGAGAQVLFATVTAGTALTASDFVIV
ncbi:MAG: calcium-binding protein [Piscinibacter sp.]|uniref:calcium-binding protein n=1 Tax=Piscinibacter TaxID=1114981 RepID=UPI0013E3D549|nr:MULTISPECIES: calcium-binding protein [Piscinibacter]MCW5667952.1 calcium-binding protein [Piscinibacter sp.]